MGNFPRLTNVLSEEELKSLLLKLVRSIKIEQNEQTRTLQLISSFDNRHTSHGKKKTSKNNATKTKAKPHGTTDLGNAQDDSSKSIARPHTCPETVLSSSSLSKATAKERASKTPFVPSKIRSGESKSNDTSTTVPPTLSTHRTQILDISIIQKNMKKFARILKGTKAHNQTQRGKIRWTSNILNTTSSVVYLLYQFSFDTEWQIFNLKIFNMSSNSFHEYSYEYSEQEILSHMRSIEQHKETKETLRQKIVERHIQALMTRLVVFS
jgi:hypothetical protein